MPSLIENSNEVMKEQDEEVEAVPTGAALEIHTAVDSEPLIVPETNGKIDENTPLESTEDVGTSEPQNGVAEVQHEEVPVSTDWNSVPANGGIAGWISAEPPLGLENGVAHEDAAAPATTESGVLGSAPAAKAVEKPPPQVYNFYMVKVPRPVDRQGKAEINAAGQKWQDKQEQRKVQNDTVQEARTKRNDAFEKLKAAREVERGWFLKIREKLDLIAPLRVNLRKIKEAGRQVREKGRDMPTSEEDLDHRIASLEWRIQHESIPLKEEKQLMRDIKQLQSSRETVRQNAVLSAQVNEAMGKREELESALRPLEADLKQLEGERKIAKTNLEKIEVEFNKFKASLEAVQGQLQSANGMMQEAYAHHRTLKDQEYHRMRDHYDNKRDIQEAKLLASKQYNSKDVEAFCSAQVERMLEMWNTNDEFRKNYVKDNEVSTVRRLGTFDGRSLGPDESRPVLANTDAPFSAVPASQQSGGRASVKEAAPARAGKVEAAAAVVEKEAESAPAPVAEEKPVAKRDAQKVPAPSPPVEEVKSKEELEREAAELKEQRRATEMAKAKEAEERKKRIAERAQAKAQAWAQKEAERKEKEKEKKARKKTAAVAPAESGNLSDSAPAAESADGAAETQEPVPEETKVSSRQRKRGVTNTQKQAARAARANAPTPPARVKQQKLFGMPLQVVLGAGLAALLAVLVFFLFRSTVWSSATSSGKFEEGTNFKARPDASSQSYH